MRLCRGEDPEAVAGSEKLMAESFPDGSYLDVPGLCRVATLKEIEAQGWSLNPGRYVGVADREEDELVFAERLEELHEELEILNTEAARLQSLVDTAIGGLLNTRP